MRINNTYWNVPVNADHATEMMEEVIYRWVRMLKSVKDSLNVNVFWENDVHLLREEKKLFLASGVGCDPFASSAPGSGSASPSFFSSPS